MKQIGRLIGQGNTAEIYEYGSDKILKLYRNGMPDFICENEFNITKNIYDSFGFAPESFEIVQIDSRNGAVYEKIAGRTMMNNMLSRLWRINQQTRLLAHYHLAIQKPVNFKLPTVKEKLKQDIENVKQFSDKEKDKIFAYIDDLPDGNTLCHFDFHPGNIIIRDGQPVIIDWMTACSGNALSDVARTGIMLKYSDIPMKSRLIKNLIRRLKSKMYDAYLQEYLKISKTDVNDILKWEFPIAAARLREWIPEEKKKRLWDVVYSFIK